MKANFSARGAAMLGGGSLAAAALGFIRDPLLGASFGPGPEIAAYLLAFRLPDAIFAIFGMGVLSAAFLPTLADVHRQNARLAMVFFGRFLAAMWAMLAALAALVFVFAPFLVDFFFQPPSPAFAEQVVFLTRLMLISPLLFGLSNSFGNALLFHQRFAALALAPVLYSLGVLGGAGAAALSGNIYLASFGAIAGAALHFCFRLLEAIFFARIRPALTDASALSAAQMRAANAAVRQCFFLAIPRMVALAIGFCVPIFFDRLALSISPQTLTVWAFARNAALLPVALVGLSLGLAALPSLAEQAKKTAAFRAVVGRGMHFLMLFALPAALGLWLIADVFSAAIFGHGKFSESSVVLLGAVIAALSLAIPAEALREFCSRVFTAQKKVLAVLLARLVFAATGIGLALLWLPKMGAVGMGFAFAAGVAAESAALLFVMAVADWLPLPRSSFMLRLGLALGLMTGLVLLCLWIFSGFVALISAVFCGAGVFFAAFFMPQLAQQWRLAPHFLAGIAPSWAQRHPERA